MLERFKDREHLEQQQDGQAVSRALLQAAQADHHCGPDDHEGRRRDHPRDDKPGHPEGDRDSEGASEGHEIPAMLRHERSIEEGVRVQYAHHADERRACNAQRRSAACETRQRRSGVTQGADVTFPSQKRIRDESGEDLSYGAYAVGIWDSPRQCFVPSQWDSPRQCWVPSQTRKRSRSNDHDQIHVGHDDDDIDDIDAIHVRRLRRHDRHRVSISGAATAATANESNDPDAILLSKQGP